VSQVPGPQVDARPTIGLIGEGLSVVVPEQGARVPLRLNTTPGRRLSSVTSCQLPVPVLDYMQRTHLSCRLNYNPKQDIAGGVLVTNPDGVS